MPEPGSLRIVVEQMEAFWENGVVVAEREDAVNRYHLYQVDAFYVEVELSTERNVRIAFYEFASINAAMLQSLLDKIEVSL